MHHGDGKPAQDAATTEEPTISGPVAPAGEWEDAIFRKTTHRHLEGDRVLELVVVETRSELWDASPEASDRAWSTIRLGPSREFVRATRLV